MLVSPQTLTLEIAPVQPLLQMATRAIGHGTSNYVIGHKKGCGFLIIHYLEVKLHWEVQSGPNNLSIIENWEVVSSSEGRNVLSLRQIQSIP